MILFLHAGSSTHIGSICICQSISMDSLNSCVCQSFCSSTKYILTDKEVQQYALFCTHLEFSVRLQKKSSRVETSWIHTKRCCSGSNWEYTSRKQTIKTSRFPCALMGNSITFERVSRQWSVWLAFSRFIFFWTK